MTTEAQQGPTADAALRLAVTTADIARQVSAVSQKARALKMTQPANEQVASLQEAIVTLLQTMLAHSSAISAVIEENRLRRAPWQQQHQQ